MGHVDERSFAEQVIRTYCSLRADAVDHNLRVGRGKLLGQPHGRRLFDKAIEQVAEQMGASMYPYRTAYQTYTTVCLDGVWLKTRDTVSAALTERYHKHRGLPTSDDGRRTLVREIVGERAYYAIVNSLGGYFELSLVIDTLFAQVLSQALPPPVVAAKGAVRTPAAPAIAAPIRPTPEPVRRTDRVVRSTTKKKANPEVQLRLPFV